MFGTHIKAKKTDGGGYRAMESENKVNFSTVLLHMNVMVDTLPLTPLQEALPS